MIESNKYDIYIWDLEAATKDFSIFSEAESWYKHLGNGKKFRLERKLGYQYDAAKDPMNYHWHFHLLDEDEETSTPVIIFNRHLGCYTSKEHWRQLLDFLNLIHVNYK